MKTFVSEQIIDEIAVLFSDEQKYTAAIKEIMNKQADVISYFDKENHSLLTDDEYDYLWFLFVVIYSAYEEVNDTIPFLEGEIIETIEEETWKKLNESKETSFKKKLDVFFENYPQEDLLAFLEDALLYEEDGPITQAGREFIFVPLKTVMDAICL